MKNFKRFAPVVVVLLVLLALPLLQQNRKNAPATTVVPVQTQQVAPPPVQAAPQVYAPVQTQPPRSSGVIENAFRSRRSKVPVTESGSISRILADDNDGSRHQRFIVTLSSGHTVLIAHNIDIAPRINSLRESDSITFSGVYEWNDKGGVVHWTHHDPNGRHAGGYLYHNGYTYQ